MTPLPSVEQHHLAAELVQVESEDALPRNWPVLLSEVMPVETYACLSVVRFDVDYGSSRIIGYATHYSHTIRTVAHYSNPGAHQWPQLGRGRRLHTRFLWPSKSELSSLRLW